MNGEFHIKITKNGPYVVSGGVPLSEKLIIRGPRQYEFKEGRPLPQSERYALCRCGNSKTPPFCDGAHAACGFCGEETADRTPYLERAEYMQGPGLDLLDDGRCAFARFCHRGLSTAWKLTEQSHSRDNQAEAILAASDCPAGRLTAVDKEGRLLEPDHPPSIEILQDPEKQVSGGIFVRGGIPLEGADGTRYELRNRMVLCRCGGSRNKPFCDARHVSLGFLDRRDI
ncbi:hypothetical protein SDC9_111256 [bioreactor metagenome]|uniref:Iron-binding zinc finger CDGSH type domain-containing protein n=1 Tax=bioreactor metagenome TaxID=1076179 RepID=A0A645BG07_9ZZZZ